MRFGPSGDKNFLAYLQVVKVVKKFFKRLDLLKGYFGHELCPGVKGRVSRAQVRYRIELPPLRHLK